MGMDSSLSSRSKFAELHEDIAALSYVHVTLPLYLYRYTSNREKKPQLCLRPAIRGGTLLNRPFA
jgi:hypothetical protein